MSQAPEQLYHVSLSANRESILRHGLDWRRMDPAQSSLLQGRPGQPEADGIFLTLGNDIAEARSWAEMGDGGMVDVWRVDTAGLTLSFLENEGDAADGWICREVIPPKRLELVEVWDTDDAGEPRSVPLPATRRSRFLR